MEVKEEAQIKLEKIKETRLAELYNLKNMIEQAKGNNNYQSYEQNSNIDYSNNDADNAFGSETKSYTKSLSTGVGRAMTDNTRQSGFSSALMLGIISFIFEALFLALAIFIYM